ncbi:phage tail sheath C-terminal domain-containing protein [Clostridium botulinum]|uniref:phage tail sheath C-terminal domain-containing protein n=1 Tax=Clostridium botulinum TaxID=1491 RepID=UPI001C9B6742|nr:phage tail sheath C-terminal domain-containing protein [Clostridium botulinum]MBY6860802.1 phage tail protein [Clostridium botulinum]MBY7043809.1 phage tail protein [Clostridium botulinum]
MTLTLPKAEIKFRELADSFFTRSERGTAILIIKDTLNSFKVKEYTEKKDFEKDKKLYLPENFQFISDIFLFGTAKVIVVPIAEDGNVEDALKVISKKCKTGWISTVGTPEEYKKIADWVKVHSEDGQTFKTITFGTEKSDHECVVDFANPTVTFKDNRGTVTGEKYIPSLLGIFAACNVERGVTYYICKNLLEVEEVDDVKVALNSGKFVLINDYDVVRVGLGINSLTTFNDENEKFEDMRYLDIIEAIHLMSDDIKDTYRTAYVGIYKNCLDNQILFISAVNTFFNDLAELNVLDKQFENKAYIDVATQRKNWEQTNPLAKTWDDTKIKNLAFKRSIFLAADVKILGAMEDLNFGVNVN